MSVQDVVFHDTILLKTEREKMKLLEIKNNLVKLSCAEAESPVLGRFIVLTSEEKSYVAQFVNLKSDTVNNFAIAKLLFTFTPDGVVDNYDGSVPSINSELSLLPSEELLKLLPVETPIKIGNLSQQEDVLNLDVSVFERNLTVFVEKDSNKSVFISNCIRQLFQMKEKSVIIDTDNLFEDYPRVVIGKDFKLPLNAKMIDYLFDYELSEVEPATKAVIQDIFYAVQQYIKTLDFEFLPIDNFVDVVANQYKEIQMPELALLKNKLLKYRDANIFANSKDEVLALREKIDEKNCVIIDLKDIHETLQKEALEFIHSTLEAFDKYIYFFTPLNDENSDKKLLKRFINHNHVFTTMLVSSSYKYSEELKQHAQNIILFAPQSVNNDFAAYNTFLNKLNPDECIVFGKLTQGIPFIVDMTDLELDLLKEDVLGDKYQFIPAVENLQLVKIDQFGNQIPVDLPQISSEDDSEYDDENESEEVGNEISADIPIDDGIAQSESYVEEPVINTENPFLEEEIPAVIEEPITTEETLPSIEPIENSEIIEPIANVLDESPITEETLTPADLDISDLPEIAEEEPSIAGVIQENNDIEAPLTEDDLDFLDGGAQIASPDELFGTDEVVQEDFSDYQDASYMEEQTPVVPVYPADEDLSDAEVSDFAQGDSVTHPRYGRGVVEKIIKYGNKTLCSISFENVGRRLLDPTISELTKL